MKPIFCANCQSNTEHTVTLTNGEIVATCVVCSRTIKFPSTGTTESFRALLELHHAANVGQVPAPEPESPTDSLDAFLSA
jgi:ribosomal protein S27E